MTSIRLKQCHELTDWREMCLYVVCLGILCVIKPLVNEMCKAM